MSKHKLFVPDESSFNSSMRVQPTPNGGGRHPALDSSPEQGDRSCDANPTVENPEETRKKSNPDSALDDSDSDPVEFPGFFSNTNQKLPYTRQEDEVILKYVLKGQNIFKVSSISLWKHLESKKDNPRRTYHSLKNRFMRNIKPHIFSSFNYLIKDKETTEKVLLKFPELKKYGGRRETLSRLNLPGRKCQSKPTEDDGVSSTSPNEIQTNAERTSPFRKPDSVDRVNLTVHPEPMESEKLIQVESRLLGPDFFKSGTYEREIIANKDDLIICVDLKSIKNVETSFSSTSVGIYEKFQKIIEKNKLVYCPTCGRYNLPKQVASMKSSDETDVLVPNSLETAESASRSSKRIRLAPKLRSTQTTGCRRMNSTPESSVRTPFGPNLLTNISEVGIIDKQVAETSDSRISRNNADEALCRKQATRSSKCLSSRNKTNSSGRSNEPVREATAREKRVPNLKSNKTANSVTQKQSRDNDTNFDSICEDAMANFRKLIDYEEEKQLVRKCLNRNFKSIGLEAVSQTNLDSYFLESSSDTETTPPLTIDFAADTGSKETEERSAGATGSLLSQNSRQLRGTRQKS